MTVPRRRTWTAVAVVLMALLTACDGSAEPESDTARTPRTPPQVTVVARDYSYEMPAEIPAGVVTLTLRNEGREPHHAQVARLNDGVTAEQFIAAREQGPAAAAPLISRPGGPGQVATRLSQAVTLDLPAGQYVIYCAVEGPDRLPHLAKGMVQPFTVQ